MNVEPINPGDLNRRVKIIRVSHTIGAKGQDVETRTEIAERWASIDIDASDEDVEDSNIQSVAWLDITMYRYSGLVVTDEIVFDGRRFNVTSINEVRMTPFVKVRAREVLGLPVPAPTPTPTPTPTEETQETQESDE